MRAKKDGRMVKRICISLIYLKFTASGKDPTRAPTNGTLTARGPENIHSPPVGWDLLLDGHGADVPDQRRRH
eukprot:1627373-Pyramimonas_sp.AAC.1